MEVPKTLKTWSKSSVGHIVAIQNKVIEQWVNDEVGDATRNVHERVQCTKVFVWEVFEQILKKITINM